LSSVWELSPKSRTVIRSPPVRYRNGMNYEQSLSPDVYLDSNVYTPTEKRTEIFLAITIDLRFSGYLTMLF
jgi:hypothetical protein